MVRLQSPINYTWNFSYQRDLPAGIVVEAAYIGRSARNLLAGRDAVQTNLNFRDPASRQTWTDAATILEIARAANTPIAQHRSAAFLRESLCTGARYVIVRSVWRPGPKSNTQAVYRLAKVFNGNDWTTTQDDLDNFHGSPVFLPATIRSTGRLQHHSFIRLPRGNAINPPAL